MHPYQFYLLKKYGGPDLTLNIMLDDDAPGQNAINKISKKYADKAKINKIMLPKNYKDIDEYIRQGNDLFFLANL